MAKLSRKAQAAVSVLRATIPALLAADAKMPDLKPMMAKVTAKTWATDKPKLKAALDAALKGKLAQDADLEDLVERLEGSISDVQDDAQEVVAAAADPDLDKPAEDMDGEEEKRLRDALKAKGMSDEDVDAVVAAMKGDDAPPPPAVDADKDDKKDVVTKAAMDKAVKIAADAAAKTAEVSTIARLRAIQQAEDDVRPIIGKIAAMDSAPAVYKLALDHLQVDLTGVPESGYGAILRALPKPSDKPAVAPRVAMDSKAVTARNERFPNANRLSAY